MNNVNTKSYWENRFVSGDWETKGGRNQTRKFAESQIKYLNIPKNFTGTILDFGCGLGDAFPIYKKAFPSSTLFGFDISEEAIKKCDERYGHIARFICGTHLRVPKVDIIIASNVFEHLDNYIEIARDLISKCQILYIIVPYDEHFPYNPNHEHVNTYKETSFGELSEKRDYKKFFSKGWGPSGMDLVINVYIKNIGRFLLNREKVIRPKQILFIIRK